MKKTMTRLPLSLPQRLNGVTTTHFDVVSVCCKIAGGGAIIQSFEIKTKRGELLWGGIIKGGGIIGGGGGGGGGVTTDMPPGAWVAVVVT